ncbi:type II toxin-antitoxin system HicB family antitoxin, partial [Yersinia intermedia]|uniref:type II toxin-antitoxin system HicB family antitoxin n=1 Tax=Yersinia intermedia TaxID=631 RepID=UPI0022FEAFC6
SQDEIAIVIRDVILLTLEKRLINPVFSVEDIKDAGFIVYSNNVEYSYCDAWLVIDVDLSAFEGKQHRISIALPDCLLTRIDYVVQNNNVVYRDRSHFFCQSRAA